MILARVSYDRVMPGKLQTREVPPEWSRRMTRLHQTAVTKDEETGGSKERLLAIDLFRGVVMFLLIAESTGLYGELVSPAFEGTIIQAIGLQFQHHPWNGLRLWDLGQPFFMFISGVAMYFSYARRWEEGEPWKDSLFHALKRSLILFSLGWAIYRIVPVADNPHGAFMYDVLPHLAFASFLAFLMLRRRVSQQLILAFGLIALTELLFRLLAMPGFDRPFEPGHNFGSFIDHLLLGGLSGENWVAFNIVPSSAFVIWGVIVGRLLRNPGGRTRKILTMLATGLGGVILGLALSSFTPIIRRISTSSFVIMSGGLCLLGLALAYWLMDVLRIRKGVSFFLAVGMNPLFIYLFAQTGGADWLRPLATPFSVGAFSRLGEWQSGMATSVTILGLMWGLCYWLYHRKIFIKI
jgi:predicted acyltransferase